MMGSMSPSIVKDIPPRPTCDTWKTYWLNVATSRATSDLLPWYKVAIAPVDGKMQFYEVNNETWTLDHKMAPLNAKAIVVEGKSLSTLMKDLHTPKIDVLKISVEGAEPWVL